MSDLAWKVVVALLGGQLVACNSRATAADAVAENDRGVALSWTVADLGPGRCTGVNAGGQVLGSDDSGASFVVDSRRVRVALGGLASGAMAVGVAIAANGDVVGYSESAHGRAAARYAAGAWSLVEHVPGVWSAALAIDDRGRIVGVSGTGAHAEMHAFAVENGAAVDLPVPAQDSAACLAAAGGRVAGIVETPSGTHAFVVANGGMTDLGMPTLHQFQSFTSFTIPVGTPYFVPGVNTLDFTVTDQGVVAGLLVGSLSGTAAPIATTP